MNPFTFAFQFFDVLISWINQLFNLLSYEIDFSGENVPLWAIMGVSGAAIVIIIKLIRGIL